jgi:hypothetical protein
MPIPSAGVSEVKKVGRSGDVLSDTWALWESKVGNLIGTQSKPGLPASGESSASGAKSSGSGETPPPSSR